MVQWRTVQIGIRAIVANFYNFCQSLTVECNVGQNCTLGSPSAARCKAYDSSPILWQAQSVWRSPVLSDHFLTAVQVSITSWKVCMNQLYRCGTGLQKLSANFVCQYQTSLAILDGFRSFGNTPAQVQECSYAATSSDRQQRFEESI